MKVFALVFSSLIIATTIQNASSECTVMKEEDALEKRKSVRDALKMKLVEEKQCAYLRRLYQHMELAKKSYLSLMI